MARRGVFATALGRYCLAAVAAASSVSAAAVAANAVPSTRHRVSRNDAPRRRTEERRRLQREYYRRLAESASSAAASFSETPRNNVKNDNAARRRLPAGVHKKGGRSSDDDDARARTAVSHHKGNDQSGVADDVPPPPPPPASATQGQGDDNERPPVQRPDRDPDPSGARRATNLRSFTRTGGGGSYALPSSTRHPYMASLQMEGHTGPANDETFDVHVCGGVLIAPDLILTAAHCAKYSPPGSDETVRAFNGVEVGKSDLSDEGAPFDPLSLETYSLYYENLVPDELIVHPRYDERTYEHDVMLVKVFGKSRFPPARLLGRGEEMDQGSVTVLGWGASSATSSKKYSDVLRGAEMDLLSRDECRRIEVDVRDPNDGGVSTLSLRDHVYDDMACASSSSGARLCYGDAGGPAIQRGDYSDEDRVVGVLSWGYGCVDPAYPAVMAKVSDHLGWIRDRACDESSDPPDWFGCPEKITAMSGGGESRRTVTLKLKLDTMAVETGFVIEVLDTREIVAQRQTGYYKSEGNEIVLETMELPRDECYRLVMLDSYGDGNCCDMGGGPARLYMGTNVGYYDGTLLTEVSGQFEYDNSGEFCLDRSLPVTTPRPTRKPATRPVNNISNSGSNNGSSGGNNNGSYSGNGNSSNGGSGNGSNSGSGNGSNGGSGNGSNGGSGNGSSGGNGNNSDNGSQGGSVSDEKDVTSGWSGPVTNPEFNYCNQFCRPSKHGMMCGRYECVHVAESDALDLGGEAAESTTTDAPTGAPSPAEEGALTSDEFYSPASEYFLTVQFQFDDRPDDVSWVLYDLTLNEVKVFVDFDVYSRDEYANQLLNVRVTTDGPLEGEKQYAFTVYDKSSDGLCCAHGEGYYKVFLGSHEDAEELLGDAEFDFSSSFYFTLFEEEMQQNDAALVTETPTGRPSARPTREPTEWPTPRPTRHPTRLPTRHPVTAAPTTARPTDPWERKRFENVDEIGSRWNIRANTPPGVFNDVGGDQRQFMFHVEGLENGATRQRGWSAGFFVVLGLVLVFSLVLLQ